MTLASAGLTAAAQGVRPLSGSSADASGGSKGIGSVQPAAEPAVSRPAQALDVPAVAPIGPNGQLRLTEPELDLLAHIINGEARGEPFPGQVAVGAVVLNRVRAGGEYGNTVAQVVYSPGQFEPVSNGQINLIPTASSYRAALAAAQGQDPTGGALYFWAPDKTFSSYLWSRPFKAEIGGHLFTG